jgi:hypothetical protein
MQTVFTKMNVETAVAMNQVVSHRPLTVEVHVCTWVSPCGICGRHSSTRTGFSPSSLIFPCQYHSTMALHTHISFGG